MKVRAIRTGYYNFQRRKPEEVFVLDNDADLSERWMEQVEQSEPLEPRTAAYDRKVEQAKKDHAAALESTKPVEPKVYAKEKTSQPYGRQRKSSSNKDVF